MNNRDQRDFEIIQAIHTFRQARETLSQHVKHLNSNDIAHLRYQWRELEEALSDHADKLEYAKSITA
jgi:hypothetical protein